MEALYPAFDFGKVSSFAVLPRCPRSLERSRFMRKSSSVSVVGGAIALLVAATGCTSVSTSGSPSSTGAGSATGSTSVAAVAGVDSAAAAMVPADLKAKGSLTFVHDASYPPFESFAADNKTIVGFDVDLANAIAATMGLKATHVNAGFDTILPGISSKKYDVGMSAFSITPARAKSVDFVTYLDGGTGIAVMAGNPTKLTMDPAKLCGHTIAAENGSIQGLNLLPQFSAQCVKDGKAPIKSQLYPTQSAANLALTSGRADAVIADSISLSVQAKLSKGQFEVAPGPDYDPSPTGIALLKGSPLDQPISLALKHLTEDGTIATLMAKSDIPATALNKSIVGNIVK